MKFVEIVKDEWTNKRRVYHATMPSWDYLEYDASKHSTAENFVRSVVGVTYEVSHISRVLRVNRLLKSLESSKILENIK